MAESIAPTRELRKLPDAKKVISWPDFQRRYLRREDGYKYEWVNGFVEKAPRSMNQDQYYILDNLTTLLDQLRTDNPDLGRFYAEADTFFLENIHRRPDIAYFSVEQRSNMAYGQKEKPDFLIEIISNHDTINRVVKKMQDYRAAKVKVVWHIYPELKEVHVYRGERMTVCTGEDKCSASPVIPNFELTANLIFQKPQRIEAK
ncbi:Uma2 family endonuclease [Haliscomenobacter hydrossis]|uniref:Putative restriction endonuclease domain-containing protein n=1 Tax=Haliscomenobacter hydrossis (strain ATCC 27775 / DSM 1100 / LMG 10767 / O) TaxID=760192 RepID=F4L0I7_HALH1|nr:Uma2 family endonuclease [Haliscomenobacter hydrossis]AEE48499.1 protein of unknown function DUF820 [Haliscomenobacter hydrossis DSM 1100]